jgi:hypothetical protein
MESRANVKITSVHGSMAVLGKGARAEGFAATAELNKQRS